ELEQPGADQRVFYAVRRIDVPAIAGAARAASRFVIGQIGPRAGVIGLLGFPGDQSVLDVDFPRARAGAVHAMCRTNDLVVLPARPVIALPGAVFVGNDPVPISKLAHRLPEEQEPVYELTHERPRAGANSRSLALGLTRAAAIRS